ncbi:Receptor-type guanylate cyclase gcy [Seminavis robusta]|uniref:Receptor-type guanylate cyclase gcy n=1 Tax=Seminavis robusta TaxID=568900 RepID=A0A9N8HS28_9STRA|nr:Receptor-type guanylate cyclase gcy [Seminavis robusta]|eukprot:Sro1129_g244340.1 Receptor-type guanylate cyclase gcy (811) ;mRNA; f:6577-9590
MTMDHDLEQSVGDGNSTSHGNTNTNTNASNASGAMENEEKRLRDQTSRNLAKKENQAVFMLRILVMLLLLTVTSVVLVGVYLYSTGAEQKDFEEGFEIHAAQLAESMGNSVERKLVAFGSLATALTSYAKATGAQFPFVTLPDFAERVSETRVLGDIPSVLWMPLITDAKRPAWEDYAFANRGAVTQNFEKDNLLRQEQDNYFQQIANANTNGMNRQLQQEEQEVDPNIIQEGGGYIYHLRIYNPMGGLVEPNGTGPYLPGWQGSPVGRYRGGMINFNWDNALAFKGADLAKTLLQEQEPKVIHHAMAVPQPQFRAGVTDFLERSQYRNRLTNYVEDPLAFVTYPVFDTLNSTTRNPVGILAANTYLRVYFQGVLPSRAKGIICVLSNTYNQTVSYLVNGQNATFLGTEDVHDPKYDHMEVALDVTTFVKMRSSAETRAYLTVPLHDTIGRYYLKVYPTDETKAEYTTNNPILYTVIVGLIFVLTALVFVIFDMWVEKRQNVVMKRAVESGAIVNSLFPEQVQARLYEDKPQEKTQGNGKWKAKDNQDHGLDAVDTEKTGKQLNRGSQIADEYENCTVLFSDLAGFTAWSSARTPSEVFELLETLFNAIDAIALRRKIFKVETIGDCWLGVCGLPEPNPKHAVAMARFADDSRRKAQEIFTSLTDHLGPDTATLQLRTGLHSGSVTAGVLRGQKSRFQLFGDTVNTASRMESKGEASRIHASKTTADALIAQGKGHWLKAREDKIVAKGKGEMQTYWIDPSQDVTSYAPSTHLSVDDTRSEDNEAHNHQANETQSQAHETQSQAWTVCEV